MFITLHCAWDLDFLSREVKKRIAEIGHPMLDVGSTHVKVRVWHMASCTSHIAHDIAMISMHNKPN